MYLKMLLHAIFSMPSLGNEAGFIGYRNRLRWAMKPIAF